MGKIMPENWKWPLDQLNPVFLKWKQYNTNLKENILFMTLEVSDLTVLANVNRTNPKPVISLENPPFK